MGLLDNYDGNMGSMGGMEDMQNPNSGLLSNLKGGFSDMMADPRKKAGLMALFQGLIQAGAPRPGGASKGAWIGGLGSAMGEMTKGQLAYDQQDMANQLKKFQIEHAKLQNANQQGMMDWQKKYFPSADAPTAPQQAVGQTSMPPTGFDPMSLVPPQAPAQAPQGGGFRGLPLPAIAQGAMLGIPGMKEQFDITKYINDGIVRKAGDTAIDPITKKETYYDKIPDGMRKNPDGSFSLIPGFNEGNSQVKASETVATEGAKSNFQTINVPIGGGRTKLMKLSDYLATGPGTPQAPSASPQSNFGVTQSPADQAYEVDTAKNSVTMFKDLQTAGLRAPNEIAKYRKLGELLDGVNGNKYSGTGLEAAKLANSVLGWKIDPNMPNKEASLVLSNTLALELRNPNGGAGMPGSMSNEDREYLKAATPSLVNSAEGRRQMVEMKVAVLERDAVVAEKARQWQQRFGRIDATAPDGKDFQTVLRAWANENPLFAKK